MPGLLDYFNSDEGALGLGLLAAGGPTTDINRSGFGQRLQGAIAQATAASEGRLDRQLKAQYLQGQIAAQDLARAEALRKAAILQAAFPGAFGAAPVAGAGAG